MNQQTILVADDDPQVRQALRTRLAAHGYRVVECRDGLGAIAKCNHVPVDVIILDHEMPLGEGRTVAHNIRENSTAPIIFLSGHERESFRNIVMQLPNTYFLSKPLDDGKLQALLGSLTSNPPRANC
jgi:DNA-binding response OmpR family regulator